MGAIKVFLKEVLLPIALAFCLASFLKPIYMPDGVCDYFLMWICVGLPFGIRRMCLWLVPSGYGISGSVGIFAFNLIIGGLIWFDEKDPLIYIRTHNTDLKKRLAAYAGQYPDQCRQTDADPETGCMEFDIAKGRFSFRLTAPYNEERRNAASKAAKKHSGNLTHPIQKDVL